MKSLAKILAVVCLSACESTQSAQQQYLSDDELFHKLVKNHQKLMNNMGQTNNSTLSYEDSAFRINRNHSREAMRVLRCAKALDGFEGQAIYQIPPRYELHYYFTGNAKEKLSKCTHDPLFVANNVKYGFDELKAVFDEANSMLKAKGIVTYSTIVPASYFLFETKPYPPSVLSEHPHVEIGVDKDNLSNASRILLPLMRQHEFLFVVEGQPLDEVLVETAVQ